MVANKDVASASAAEQAGGDGVDVRVAQELIEKAREDGVSLVGPNGLLRQVTKTVLESALNAELDEHLGYEKGDLQGKFGSNERNGTSSKTVRTDVGEVLLDVPRDREGTFTPQIVPKYARRVDGFDDTIISLYAKGLTTGVIQAHLSDIYDADVSRDLTSKITDKVVEDLNSWQSRPLDRVYPVVLIDALHVKIRDGAVANRPIYIAVGITLSGERDVLGMWVGTGSEGAKGWLNHLSDLKNRGVEDILIVACDGLKGLPDAISA
ncbi:transposase, partial [Streptomyces regensis]